MEDIEWNTQNESKLFEAMVGLKPVGVARHIQMSIIWMNFSALLGKTIPPEKIWEHLGKKFYNIDLLNEMDLDERYAIETDFILPEEEYGALQAAKEKAEDKRKSLAGKSNEVKELLKMNKEIKKEDKPIKKETPRRDSKDGKELKPLVLKKEIKKEPEKIRLKGRSANTPLKEEEKQKTPTRSDDLKNRVNKRPTRGSTKPEEGRKSESPLTLSTPPVKRRRI